MITKCVIQNGEIINMGSWGNFDDENLLPDGAEEVEVEVLITAKGRYVLASNYFALRADEYPSIQEQLDMQFQDLLDGGTRWADAIKTIKTKYPKNKFGRPPKKK